LPGLQDLVDAPAHRRSRNLASTSKNAAGSSPASGAKLDANPSAPPEFTLRRWRAGRYSVQRGLERLRRVQSVLRAHEAEDGIRLRERPPVDGEHWQRAERRARLAGSPLIAVQPFILE
jgi:hypothetical protein